MKLKFNKNTKQDNQISQDAKEILVNFINKTFTNAQTTTEFKNVKNADKMLTVIDKCVTDVSQKYIVRKQNLYFKCFTEYHDAVDLCRKNGMNVKADPAYKKTHPENGLNSEEKKCVSEAILDILTENKNLISFHTTENKAKIKFLDHAITTADLNLTDNVEFIAVSASNKNLAKNGTDRHRDELSKKAHELQMSMVNNIKENLEKSTKEYEENQNKIFEDFVTGKKPERRSGINNITVTLEKDDNGNDIEVIYSEGWKELDEKLYKEAETSKNRAETSKNKREHFASTKNGHANKINTEKDNISQSRQ